jgi:hypothetical protein
MTFSNPHLLVNNAPSIREPAHLRLMSNWSLDCEVEVRSPNYPSPCQQVDLNSYLVFSIPLRAFALASLSPGFSDSTCISQTNPIFGID